MDQPKLKNVFDKNRKVINWKYKFCFMYKVLENNRAKIANSENTLQN